MNRRKLIKKYSYLSIKLPILNNLIKTIIDKCDDTRQNKV